MTMPAHEHVQPLRCHLQASGFTLIEMLVTLTIVAILAGLAAPSLKDAVLGYRLSSYADSLVASAQLARSEAIKRNTVVQLCVSASGTSCASSGGWEQGWIVLAGSSVLLRQQVLPPDLKVIQTAGERTLNFQPAVVGTDCATLKICRANPPGKQERVVTISPTGSATVKRTKEGSCEDLPDTSPEAG